MKSTVENKIILNNQEYTYIINYKKIKNIYFRIKEDLKIYVSCNQRVRKSYIEELLIKESESIKKMYDKMLNKTNDKDLYYLGNKLHLIIDDNLYISNDDIHAKSFDEAKEYIYSLAYDIFKQRLEKVKLTFNTLPSFRLKVRKMTSKWGVCNIKSMTVTLNTELIFKDVHLIDYVIVHELSHFSHMDHSREFWKEVSKHYPYYKEARKELNY